ncbi:Isotrichodermin C-15 hydroxylase [Hirsutella minnesotensis 3608]|nr:Isotrichodermin C-15 hydroxylase [Hirsutella minnesotensis 3608]
MKAIRGRRRAGADEHQKDPFRDVLRNNILGADKANHARYRSSLANAFSHQSILAKQPIINGHVDKLIQHLNDCCAGGTQTVDIMQWFSYVTFDIIGDLSFGESFGCLDSQTYHPWVELIFTSFKNRWYLSTLKRYPLLLPLLKRAVMPTSLASKYSEHRNLSAKLVQKRLSTATNRPDFMTSMTSKDGPAALTFDELVSNATVLIAAGSETTATALTAATYYLALHPDVLAKLAAEVRSAFVTEADIDLLSVQHLPYMLAVLDEAMRLCPPAPGGQPRVIAKGGDEILGQYVAEGTFVEVWQWANYRDPAHFSQPGEFIPERWLGDARFEHDKREAVQPFSVGPRDCIGKNLAYSEMRLILARLIWEFDITLAEDSIGWDERNKFYMMYAKGPVKVYLRPRSKE